MSIPRTLLLLAGLMLVAAGCQTVPKDPFMAGEQALADGRLLPALAHLDRVSPRHERYAEARAMALAVERRMRKAQEYLMRGLQLRAEWRDEEAIPWFERAREVWPQVVGAEQLITATQSRMTMLSGGEGPAPEDADAGDGGEAAPVASTTPVAVADPTPQTVTDGQQTGDRGPAVPSAGGGEPLTPIGDGGRFELVPAAPGGAGPTGAHSPAGSSAPTTPGEAEEPVVGSGGSAGGTTSGGQPGDAAGPVAQTSGQPAGASAAQPELTPEQAATARLQRELADVEEILRAGQLDLGIEELQRLAGEWPQALAVVNRLARVLHQRALLRYGQGHLAAAIADWDQVCALQPGFASAERFTAAARAELALRKP